MRCQKQLVLAKHTWSYRQAELYPGLQQSYTNTQGFWENLSHEKSLLCSGQAVSSLTSFSREAGLRLSTTHPAGTGSHTLSVEVLKVQSLAKKNSVQLFAPGPNTLHKFLETQAVLSKGQMQFSLSHNTDPSLTASGASVQ